MVQAIHARNLPRVKSYAEAMQCYMHAHQHARFGDWRGLKDKRDETKRIRLSSTGAVLFRYHATDVVAWHPDQVRVVCYDSQSTVVFADRFLPDGLVAESYRREMGIRKTTTGECYLPTGSVPLTFDNVDGDWVVHPGGVRSHTRTVTDRKLAYKTRKALRPFLDWLATMQRIGTDLGDDKIPRPKLLPELKDYLVAGEIPTQFYRHMAVYEWRNRDHESLIRQCLILSGAVTRVELPPGQVPKKKCIYEGLPAWRHVEDKSSI